SDAGTDAGSPDASTDASPGVDGGSACTDVAQCPTGFFCVDGVCCESECGGNNPDDCQACQADGKCHLLGSSHQCYKRTDLCASVEKTLMCVDGQASCAQPTQRDPDTCGDYDGVDFIS